MTSVVDDSRSDLDAALKNLSDVVGETQRFIEGTRDKTAEQIRLLADVTQNLADHRMDLENVLHIAPHSIANAYNMFDPRTGAASGVFVLNNLSNPVWAICTMIGALENVTSPETGKLCSQYVGPALQHYRHQQHPVAVQPVPDRESAGLHAPIHRGQAQAGERRDSRPRPTQTRPLVSAYTGCRRCAAAAGLWAAAGPPARGAAAHGASASAPATDVAGHAAPCRERRHRQVSAGGSATAE